MKRYSTSSIRFRLELFAVGTLLLFSLLLFRLAQLTLVEGDAYRKTADERRVRKVYETPPRGDIRDRNGRLLAGNIPSFTAQILKDELMREGMSAEERNRNLLTLVRVLEEDGALSQGQFPIDLNVYVYDEPELYATKEVTPMETMESILSEEPVLREFLSRSLNLKRYPGHYAFRVKSRALGALREKYVDFPVMLENDAFQPIAGKFETFLKDKSFPDSLDATGLVLESIRSDRTIIRKLLDHPIARAILYEIATGRPELEHIRMRPVSITYAVEGFEHKIALSKIYGGITPTSTAEDDFLYLGTAYALDPMLRKVYPVGEGEKTVIPGEILLAKLQSQHRLEDLEIYLSEDEKSVFYRIKGDDAPESDADHSADGQGQDLVKRMIASLTPDDLRDFLLDPGIRTIVQTELLQQGINPKISVADGIMYNTERDTKNLYRRFFKAKELEGGLPDPEKLLEAARAYYEIPEDLSPYEAKGILDIYDLVSKIGEMAYRPVNLSYGLKEETVAKIEEQIGERAGVRVSIEPVRYYPMGKNSCHVLGYMGKIATDAEMNRYVRELGYDRNEFIGKTGLEESFQQALRGVGGEKVVEVDVVGNTTGVLDASPSVPGATVYTTIDAKLQAVAESGLEKTIRLVRTAGTWTSQWGDYKMDGDSRLKRPFSNCNAGAIVAVNAKTGEVLAMASYPGYDPNLFSTGISASDWKSFLPEDDRDPLAARPLYNIATQTAVQPGSTFKMLTGFAGLQKGLNPLEKIYDKGFVEVGTQKYRCLVYTWYNSSHGWMDLAHAIEQSCNYYFYSLVLGENQQMHHQKISAKVDIEDLLKASEAFGLNEATGIEINIPKETVGGVPEPEKKVIATKFYIRQFLEGALADYADKGKAKSKQDLERDIETVSSWAEEGRSLTKNELIRRLEEMGYIADAPAGRQKRSLSDVLKFDYLNQAGWSVGDTLLVSIGQGQSHFTPLQMARYISGLVNGGYKNKLTLIRSVRSADGVTELHPFAVERQAIDIKNRSGFENLKYGMGLVSSGGTSRRVYLDFPVKTGSKTGTAQREGINPTTGKPYDDFAWYVSFAPYDDPEIVIAGVLFQGGTGSNIGPLARDLMAEYLGLNRELDRDASPFTNRLEP